jgi:hypothetical protein
VRLEDLPGNVLGLASGYQNRIWLDVNAAGNGWHLGQETRGQSQGPDGSISLTPSPAHPITPSSFDLLTVVSHELGHLLGLPDLDPVAHPHDVLAGTLDAGVRRSPLGLESPIGLGSPIDLGSPTPRVFAATQLPRLTDRLFSDLGKLGATSTQDSGDTLDEAEHESFDLVQTSLQHRTPSDVAPLRVEENDTDWLATRGDDEEAVDEIFADLFGEDDGS